MPITEDEALWLYRCILGREPESADALLRTVDNSRSFTEAREAMIRSPEFVNRWSPPPCYRPSAPSAIKRRPILVVTAIMKDEAHVISDMLRSVAPIADFILLQDTGSTDRTPDIAASELRRLSVPHQISHVQFIDFANARNTLIDSTPKFADWILMLDCDERLVPEDFQALLDLLKVDCLGWKLPRYNFVDVDKIHPPVGYPDFQARLFRNRLGDPVRFAGAVHEMPTSLEFWRVGPINTTQLGGDGGGPHIHHLGHVLMSPERYEAKVKFYNLLAAQ